MLGAGATAVDSAAEALEAGAARVAMLVRRADVPRINKGMGIGSAGFWTGFYSLTDAQKFAIMNYIDEQAVPPPRGSMLRCTRHTNFSIVARCAPSAIEIRDGRVLLDTTRGMLAFDHLILATGLSVDWSQRPELAALKPHVQLWRDRFSPDGRADYAQAEHPYVGPNFEFLERDARHRAVGFAHPLFQLCGHDESRADLRRHPGHQHRGATRRERRCRRAVCRGLCRTLRRLTGWSNPELQGDEYALDEDVEQISRPTGGARMTPVVFLHGIGGGAKSFAPQMASFAARGYQPVALDMMGYGTREPIEAMSFEALAEDVEFAIGESRAGEAGAGRPFDGRHGGADDAAARAA